MLFFSLLLQDNLGDYVLFDKLNTSKNYPVYSPFSDLIIFSLFSPVFFLFLPRVRQSAIMPTLTYEIKMILSHK